MRKLTLVVLGIVLLFPTMRFIQNIRTHYVVKGLIGVSASEAKERLENIGFRCGNKYSPKVETIDFMICNRRRIHSFLKMEDQFIQIYLSAPGGIVKRTVRGTTIDNS